MKVYAINSNPPKMQVLDFRQKNPDLGLKNPKIRASIHQFKFCV